MEQLVNMRIVSTAVAALFAFANINANAQTADEAITALKMLETRCETGISYQDYSGALAEAKLPVRLFIERGGIAGQPQIAERMGIAVEHYEIAGRFWSAKFTAARDDRFLSSGLIWHKSDLGKIIKDEYPEAQMVNKFYPLDFLLPLIWEKAADEVKKADEAITALEPTEAERLRTENEQMRAEVELERLRRENEELKRKIQAGEDE